MDSACFSLDLLIVGSKGFCIVETKPTLAKITVDDSLILPGAVEESRLILPGVENAIEFLGTYKDHAKPTELEAKAL